ncbi:putative beta-hexosaminidase [Pectobacterium atrosepticum SCRI1043]|uniref:beta-N-acetylhexosaminidase n=1 Tax=Pectobacterium atrosepticum (strain SCRI 1043 / ATCC BAA-672) TaxID=218491 RepID=Q6CZJ0_PECAS|nr:glycoside hydrolase family 3 N-terminal domain-containing protein [Pectobacterium atrosepticum]MCL6318360.1 glycoside hydrolase family 3 protein [Pectobacterium atrosepticum]MCL6322933.1 glycoside hydrolase family 3 protein [Pectobacterium atrosepticum]CAG77058.1 putative beta-hexosaminidase [Pectobacterium atrosepticum SCRI1043]
MNIKQKINAMTLEEKIGQKLMLDFRYWDPTGKSNQDMTVPDETVGKLITDHHIGGVILFANNLKDKQQIEKLTAWYAAMETRGGVRLFISTDNEGGNVFRLPRSDYASFPGNMALSSAIEGGSDIQIASEQGRLMAQDMIFMHINTNFAPVVDVNTNPFNPVINVRAFSDDADTVYRLAEKMTAGMKQQGLITAYKHFPGHGSTSTDSHTGLPRVDRSRKDAFAIDIMPYKRAIDNQTAPDMVMTAHIQYPSLDNSLVTTRSGEKITVPATMSHAIQTDILRGELSYAGVTISDALDMGAIADHFSQEEAVRQVFTAGVDIALMPISISSPDQIKLLPDLIQHIVDMVKKGNIGEAEIDASVERILTLKARYHLLCEKKQTVADASATQGYEVEKYIADRSITVVINQQSLLPLKDKTLRYFILTPWGEQAKGIAAVMAQEGYLNVVAAKETELTDAQVRDHISNCDIFLLGTLSTRFTPVELDGIATAQAKDGVANNPYPSWLRHATDLGKKRVHLSLRAPYDIINYAGDVNAAVATYSYYGYDNGIWRGHSMRSLAEVLTGKRAPQGKLPVNIWQNYDVETNTGTVAFSRGFGLSW